jgi:hypothetical protein
MICNFARLSQDLDGDSDAKPFSWCDLRNATTTVHRPDFYLTPFENIEEEGWFRKSREIWRSRN